MSQMRQQSCSKTEQYNHLWNMQASMAAISLAGSLVGHEEELVSLPHNPCLAFAHGNGAHVLVLVNDGHSKGGQRVSRQGVCVV